MHPPDIFCDDLKTSMASSSTYINYYIPGELLLKILLQLPIKSLMRNRCVCKSWNQFICNKSFVTTYNKTSSNTCNNKYLLYQYPESESSLITACLVDSTKSYNVVESHDYSLDDVLGKFKEFAVYGSCNGLLCLSDYQDNLVHETIVLFNPIIRKWKKLPRLSIGFKVEHPWSMCLCFGFYEDDYKVIEVVAHMKVYHAYIYSLNTDTWKCLKFDMTHVENFIGNHISPHSMARLVNGVAYFMKFYSEPRIVCFDLIRKLVREIEFPEYFCGYGKNIIMEEYGESIALITTFAAGDVVMWILRVRMSDNTFTWEKKFSFESSTSSPCRAIGFLNNDTLVLTMKITVDIYSHRFKYLSYSYNVDGTVGQQSEIFPAGSESRKDERAKRIDFFTGNLVLLNETTLPPSAGMWLIRPDTATKRRRRR